MNPINTDEIRKAWPLSEKLSTHSEECVKWHYTCAIHRLCYELDSPVRAMSEALKMIPKLGDGKCVTDPRMVEIAMLSSECESLRAEVDRLRARLTSENGDVIH